VSTVFVAPPTPAPIEAAPRLDEFVDANAPAGYGEDDLDGVDPESEAYLQNLGLMGAAVYDLGGLRREMDRRIAGGTWEEVDTLTPSWASNARGLDERSRQSLSSGIGPRAREAAAARHSERHAQLTQEIMGERPPRPLPTPVSDMRQVLGFLERHAPESSEEIFARIAEHQAEAQAIDEAEGGIGRHRRRSTVDDGFTKQLQMAEGLAQFGRQAAAAGLEEQKRNRHPLPDGYTDPELDGSSAWERQAMLEEATIEDALNEEGLGGHSEAFAAGPYSAEARMQLGRHAIDESLSKFTDEIPALIERRAAAKKEVLAAELELRRGRNRKPTAAERRADTAWALGAVHFKEADQALFVARSLCTWDDE
jgi:hypothetical protein